MTVFQYSQQQKHVWADNAGCDTVRGYLVGVIDHGGKLERAYHHLNAAGKTGKLRLHESG